MVDQDRQYTLIAYGTPSDSRRREIVKILDGLGCRVQYSVFQAWLRSGQLSSMEDDLRRVIDPVEDSIYIVPLNEYAYKQLETLGLAQVVPMEKYWIV